MSSLPLISHHLFVAAVGPGDRRRRRPEPHASAPAASERAGAPLTLDVVDPDTAAGARQRALKPALIGA